MPIYIVRWPGLNVSLVRARNEDELIDLLDDVADPGGCRWAVYKGPLWIDLDLPVDIHHDDEGTPPLADEELTLDGVEELAEDPLGYDTSIGGEETGSEMRTAVARWAFPHLLNAVEASEEGLPSEEQLEAALRLELRELLQFYWRVAHQERRTDIESAMLQRLGLTIAPPWLKREIERLRAKRPDGDGES